MYRVRGVVVVTIGRGCINILFGGCWVREGAKSTFLLARRLAARPPRALALDSSRFRLLGCSRGRARRRRALKRKPGDPYRCVWITYRTSRNPLTSTPRFLLSSGMEDMTNDTVVTPDANVGTDSSPASASPGSADPVLAADAGASRSRSDSLKAYWADPANREKHSAKMKANWSTSEKNVALAGKRSVRIKDQNGTEYASVNDAARTLDLHASNIRAHLRGRVKHVRGYTFTVVSRPEGH